MKNAIARLLSNAGPPLPAETVQPEPDQGPAVDIIGVPIGHLRKITENALRQMHENDKTISKEILRIEETTRAEIARLTAARDSAVARLTEQKRQTRKGIESQQAALAHLAPDPGNF